MHKAAGALPAGRESGKNQSGRLIPAEDQLFPSPCPPPCASQALRLLAEFSHQPGPSSQAATTFIFRQLYSQIATSRPSAAGYPSGCLIANDANSSGGPIPGTDMRPSCPGHLPGRGCQRPRVVQLALSLEGAPSICNGVSWVLN